jgi:hypothetical protein
MVFTSKSKEPGHGLVAPFGNASAHAVERAPPKPGPDPALPPVRRQDMFTMVAAIFQNPRRNQAENLPYI